MGEIDKIRRCFLSVGDKVISGGKWKVKKDTTEGARQPWHPGPQLPFACFGFGMSGFHRRRYGRAQRHRATKRIDSCSQLAPPSLGDGQKAPFWNMVANIELQLQYEDNISWKLTPNGEYTAASAYTGPNSIAAST